MTDRINGLLVVLDKDYREDDIQSLCDAIKHMRCVLEVTKNVSDPGSFITHRRIKDEIICKLISEVQK